jgi:hypothetical protein
MVAAKIDWSVHPAPRFEGAVSDNGMDIYAFYMMVNARSSPAAQKAAWKLVRFYTDHAAQLFAGAGLFVPRKEVTDSEAYRSNPAAPFFLAELKKAQFSPRVVGYDQVLDAILRGRDKMLQGESVEAVLPVMNDEMNAVLNRERTWPRRSSSSATALPLQMVGLVFVLPAVGFFAAFNVFPMLFAVSELHGLRSAECAAVGGVRQLRQPVRRPAVLTALRNTLMFALGATVPVWVFSLLAAVLFDPFRGRDILKAAFFLPVLPPVVVVAVIWRAASERGHDLADRRTMGMTEIRWLADAVLAPLSMIAVHDWAASVLRDLAGRAGGRAGGPARRRHSAAPARCASLHRAAASAARRAGGGAFLDRRVPDLRAAIRAAERSRRAGKLHAGARTAGTEIRVPVLPHGRRGSSLHGDVRDDPHRHHRPVAVQPPCVSAQFAS